MQYVPGVFVGHAFDAGYFHHMMALGSFFQVFSMFMLSLARQEQYYQYAHTPVFLESSQIFFAQAVGIGLGMSLIFIPSLTIISHHFRKRRAFVTGMAVTGASFGGIVWPIMLNQLIQVTSFANAVRSTGAVAGVMLLVANLIMKPTKEVKPLNSGLWKSRNAHGKGEEKQRQKAEGERGARQQDQDKNAGDGKRTGKGLRPGCESSQSQRGKSKTLSMISNVSISGFKMGFGTGSGLKDILNDAPFVVSIAAACLVALGLFFPYFYLQLYAVDLGIDPTLAFYALPILNASSIAGRLLPNFFADKIGPFNMIIPCLTATSILLFSFFGVRDFAAVVVMGILYGFTSGSYLSLIPSIIGQLSKYSTQPGLRMGFAFTNVGVWMLVGAPIEGALLHPDPSTPGLFYWSRCIVFSAVMVICGALGMFLSRTLFVKAKRNGEKGQFI
ncbi:hypothetical protein VKT23_013428 [Stygiomarasmius scandens]|uniref:Major facilitator superfamily (MFS) profile domain-containing protein n=1 Tax=Marasmiellus scandens TaxID=2682957 RepID=A0ABR1J667_9AGAR